MDYKKAGVDIEAGYKSVELMKEHVKRTMREEVLGGLGGFSGAFSLKKIKEMEDPVLLSGTDGCGTKVKLAMIMDKHDTIGIDARCHVCERYCLCRRRTIILPGLHCLREKLSGKNRTDRKRCGRRMRTVRCSPDRRRDSRTSGSDAGRGIRPGRICRWCLRQKRDDHRART